MDARQFHLFYPRPIFPSMSGAIHDAQILLAVVGEVLVEVVHRFFVWVELAS